MRQEPEKEKKPSDYWVSHIATKHSHIEPNIVSPIGINTTSKPNIVAYPTEYRRDRATMAL